jgi:hypothetical protein
MRSWWYLLGKYDLLVWEFFDLNKILFIFIEKSNSERLFQRMCNTRVSADHIYGQWEVCNTAHGLERVRDRLGRLSNGVRVPPQLVLHQGLLQRSGQNDCHGATQLPRPSAFGHFFVVVLSFIAGVEETPCKSVLHNSRKIYGKKSSSIN